MFYLIIPIQGEKGLEPLPARITAKEGKHPELFHHWANTDRQAITHPCIHTCEHFNLTCMSYGVGEWRLWGMAGWVRPGTSRLPHWHYQAGSGHPLPDTRHFRPLPFNMQCLRVAERQRGRVEAGVFWFLSVSNGHRGFCQLPLRWRH